MFGLSSILLILLFILGGFLIGRTLAVLITMTIGTSMAARQGPLAMAAHQICMQVWLAVSLLTDALAASGQVHIYSICFPVVNFVSEIRIDMIPPFTKLLWTLYFRLW